MTGNDIIAAKCLSSQMAFTKYFFYQDQKKRFWENWHHRTICDALDAVVEGRIKRLIINIWPRSGKTEIAVKRFIARGLAINPSSKFIHISYSDDLACDNSDEIRETVKSEAYQRIFPYVQVKQSTDSKKKWYTTAGGGVYATSSGGQITGFGAGAVDEVKSSLNEFFPVAVSAGFAGAVVIDDPIKPDDAQNDIAREKVNLKFETTIRNRVNSINTPIIIIMQRLHENDLCGYLMKLEPDEWTVISLPAVYYEDGLEKATWDGKLPLEECHKIEKRSPFVWETQYMQNPIPKEGLMYTVFKTYKEIPYTNRRIKKNYTDSADKGADYLCSVNYIETEIGNYILDVLCTQDAMPVTEPRTAKMIDKDGIEIVNIEGNNGGEGFARNVESQLRIMGNAHTTINTFHQSANKETRIYNNSSAVQNLTYYPEGWESIWPVFANMLKSYRKAGKNAHDDVPDVLTGMIEKRDENVFFSYDPLKMHFTGFWMVEIHPNINGKFILLKACCQDEKCFVTYAYMGDILDYELLSGICKDAEVHVEVTTNMKYFLVEYRTRIGECWGRIEETNKVAKIESYKNIVKTNFYFPMDLSVRLFLNNALSFNGKDSYEAAYVLSCMASRWKAKIYSK